MDGLFRSGGLETLHEGDGVVHGCGGSGGSVTGRHAVVISVRGQHVVGRESVNQFGFGAGGVELAFLAFGLEIFGTAGKISGRARLRL